MPDENATDAGPQAAGDRKDGPQQETARGPEQATRTARGSLPAGSFRVSRVTLAYRYLFLLALTLGGIFLLYLLVPMAVADRDYLVGGLLALWALALLRYWVFLLAMPYRIRLEEDTLALEGLFRTRRIPCRQIVAMRASPVYPSYLRLVTADKKTIPMLNHVDGLHDLIGHVKRANPDLETRGC